MSVRLKPANGWMKLWRRLADRRVLCAREVEALSGEARELIGQWAEAGWLHAGTNGET